MDIDLRLMRYVVAVAECGGFQKAADLLHMSQPPLSRQIRDLERRLGVELFQRRPFRTTAAGEAFIRRARTTLTSAARLAEETRLAAVGKTGTVRLGYVLSAAYDTVPRILEEVGRRLPQIEIEAAENWSLTLEAQLRQGELDLVIAHTLSERTDFDRELLRREPLVAVVSTTHRLADQSEIHLSQLAGDTFTFYPRRHAPQHYDLLRSVLDAGGAEFPVSKDLLPGLRNLQLPDDASFTLVPASMSSGIPAGVTALPLTVADLPQVQMQIVWNATHAAPAAYLVHDVALNVASAHGWC